jgi:hypothetical protein
MVKHIEGLSDEQVLVTEIPTGIPFYYELSLPDLKPLGPIQFIGDEATVAKAKAEFEAHKAAKPAAAAVPAEPHVK